MTEEILLKVENLKMHFPILAGVFRRQVGAVKAVDGVSFNIHRGETLGLVGESGCGKSTTGRAILQLYEPTAGSVYFGDVDLAALRGEQMRRLRSEIQMIFQDAYSSLNPRMAIGEIIKEPMAIFKTATGKEADDRVDYLLEVVGLSKKYRDRFPHEFSGGQRQRIGIARALALNPKLIVLDEPISALDVSVQAQVINLLEDLQEQFGLTYLFIAHDLSVVRHISDRVAVMYLGRFAELTDKYSLYDRPLHPYTQGLLSAVPIPDPVVEETRQRIILEGDVPSPANPPSGCNFRTRFPIADTFCAEEQPEWREVLPGHFVACHATDPSKIDKNAVWQEKYEKEVVA
ncbi:MAG TPA: oligopeptide/dipeptide ABC transporter ATP-binding protein [Anaerolineales bacterium]|nr:oligopeptide/dipeptide ABC transporter ATP-binding protein [Anaerolineales bacterium]